MSTSTGKGQAVYTLTPIQAFMLSNPQPFGFVTAGQMAEVIRLDPLVPMLMRCGCNRYVVPAVLVAATIEAVKGGGDYLRDVSFTAQELEEARQSQKVAQAAGKAFVARVVREVTSGVKVNAVKADGMTLDLSVGLFSDKGAL